MRLRTAFVLALAVTAAPALAQNAAVPVSVVVAEQTDWSYHIESVGLLDAAQAIDISPSVSGLVVQIDFESGQKVKRNQTLLRLETGEQQAQSADARAALVDATANLERTRELYKTGVAAKASLDKAQAAYDQARAKLQTVTASIDRRIVSAPFDGLLGITDIKLGDFLQPGSKVVNIQDISSMRVRFIVGQREFVNLAVKQPIKVYVDSFPGSVFDGIITAIEPSVNARSGVVLVQANLPNPDAKLRSGMFAKIEIDLPAKRQKIVLPQTAVAFNLYGESIYVVKEENGKTVSQIATVTTGERREDKVVVESGVTAGDKVVTDGQLRLISGAPVRVVPNQTPQPANPVPLQ